jgi:hypothetical protein
MALHAARRAGRHRALPTGPLTGVHRRGVLAMGPVQEGTNGETTPVRMGDRQV